MMKYGVIELMGYRQIVGRYGPAEEPLAGLLRVEIIDGDGECVRVQNVGVGSIYALTELTDEEAIQIAGRRRMPSDPIRDLLPEPRDEGEDDEGEDDEGGSDDVEIPF